MTWPWNRGRGRSRSLKRAPFNRSYTTFYRSAIVSIVVPFSSYLTLNNCDLEIWVRGHHSRSFKLVRLESYRAFFYSPSIVNIAVPLSVKRLWDVQRQTWVSGCSRSLKMAPFDRPYTPSYWSAVVRSGTVIVKAVHDRSIKVGRICWKGRP